MKEEICQKCPAYSEPGPCFSSKPTGKLRAIIVGEAPGHNEIKEGKPFVGQSGWTLWKAARQAGLDRSETYTMNVARCLTKHPGAFNYCWRHFGEPEIKALPEETPIIALGKEAKEAVAPEVAYGILSSRGTRKGRSFFALHPSFIRRTARAGDSEKQDLTPTLTYDIGSALEKTRNPPLVVHESVIGVGGVLSCDLETAGNLNPRHGPIDQIGFGSTDGTVYREHYTEDHRELYQSYLRNNHIIFHNADFDIYWLEHHKYERIENFEDTLLGAHLLHGDLPLGLDFVNSLYTHVSPWWRQTKKSNWSDSMYHATDLYTTALIWDRMRLELKSEGLWDLYSNEIKPITRRCIDMKAKGVKINIPLMHKMQIGFQMQIDKIDKSLNRVAPGINWQSSPQVIDLLYNKLGLPVKLNEDKRPTADADALEELVQETGHPVLKLLLMRRSFAKMKGTYTDHEVDEDGFFHFDVSFTTATGRARGFILTIPRGQIRSLFIPDEPGWKIAYLDWSSVELWISAVCSGDTEFQRILRETKFHAYVGTQVFGREIKKGMEAYEQSKHITHGFNFGRSERAIAIDHEILLQTVQKFTGWMNTTFRQWKAYRERRLNEARDTGSIINPFGYRRYMWSGNIKGMAYSFDPQSCVAHMIKRVVIQMFNELPNPARVIFPFHDAVAITYPEEMEQEVLNIAKPIMEQEWPQLNNTSFKCEVGTGYNLYEASST